VVIILTVEVKKLEETKGTFTLRGKIDGLNSDYAVREGVTSTDKDYKALSFFVQTSPTNRVKVEMFGMEREVIYYSSKAKQSKRVPFENRDKVNLKGYQLMGVNINASGKKNDRKTLIEYDAVDYIREHFSDGDSVYIKGQIDFSEFENQHGEKINKTSFRLSTLKKEEVEIDFNDEDFIPHAFFKQDIVVSELMEEEGKLFIHAKIIKYKGDLADATFVVDAERLKKFSKTLKKNLKFGDWINVKGWIVSETIETEEEPEEEGEDWGGETPEGMDNNYIKEYINELQIVNVDKETYEPQKYTEEDLYTKEEEDFGDDEDPEDDEDDDFEEDDDELPFAE
jgi:hypothetical protein